MEMLNGKVQVLAGVMFVKFAEACKIAFFCMNYAHFNIIFVVN